MLIFSLLIINMVDYISLANSFQKKNLTQPQNPVLIPVFHMARVSKLLTPMFVYIHLE